MRLVNRGGEPLTFVADGLPTWEPGAELDVADALAEKLLAERPNLIERVPEPKAEPEPVKAKVKDDKPAGDGGEKAVNDG